MDVGRIGQVGGGLRVIGYSWVGIAARGYGLRGPAARGSHVPPQRLVGLARRGEPGASSPTGVALGAHPLDLLAERDRGAEHVSAGARRAAGHQRAVQRPARRRPSRRTPSTVAAVSPTRVAQLPEGPHRQRRRDDRHEQRVGQLEHALGDQRDARRAVEDDEVVVVAQRLEDRPSRCVGLLARGRARGRGGAARSRRAAGRGPAGRTPGSARRPASCSAHELARAAAELRPDAQQERGRRLRIEIPQERPPPSRAASQARLTAAEVFPTPPLML